MNRQEETSNILIQLMIKLPEEINRTIHDLNSKAGINLYKYREGNTYPLISTFLTYCFCLGLDPGLFISLACRIQRGKLSEKQALAILSNYASLEMAVTMNQTVLLDEICRKLGPQ